MLDKGYKTDEKVIGFYNIGDRDKFWGSRDALWGGLWGVFSGGLFMSVPVGGHVVVLGYLATMAHGPTADIARAKAILATTNPSRLDVHVAAKAGAALDLVNEVNDA